MASAVIQACLVFALCAALTSTCQGAMVYGSTLRESPSIGLGGNLSDVARLQKDQAVGDVLIVSSDTFIVSNFSYTGMAPSVHWVTANSASKADLENYMLLNPDRMTMNYTMTDLIVPVSSNVSWASTNIIALYCTQYKALFGSVDLKMAMANKGMGMAPSMSMGSVSTGGRKML